MSTLTKAKKGVRSRRSARPPVALVSKAVPGNPFAGVEHIFGSLSFPPIKGKALKQRIRARILADNHP